MYLINRKDARDVLTKSEFIDIDTLGFYTAYGHEREGRDADFQRVHAAVPAWHGIWRCCATAAHGGGGRRHLQRAGRIGAGPLDPEGVQVGHGEDVPDRARPGNGPPVHGVPERGAAAAEQQAAAPQRQPRRARARQLVPGAAVRRVVLAARAPEV